MESRDDQLASSLNASVASEDRPRRQRVRALAPDERRSALIEATIPLLREHGASVSTRQIADAAGVAEGTIFGVFPDKPSLIRAAVLAAFDPQPIVNMLSTVVPLPGKTATWRRADLRRRLVAIVTMLDWRLALNAPLIGIVRDEEFDARLRSSRQAMLDAMTGVIEPDRDLLRRPPAAVARHLISMIFANSRGFGEAEPLDGHEIVSILLDGLLVRP